jgi:hypothetical protein
MIDEAGGVILRIKLNREPRPPADVFRNPPTFHPSDGIFMSVYRTMTEFERLLWVGDRTNVGILLSEPTSDRCKVKPYCAPRDAQEWKPLREVIVLPDQYVPPSER